MASPCLAIVRLGTCSCVSCQSTSDQKAWGAHRVVAGEGGGEQRQPVGDFCFECKDAAAERWPHEAWDQTAARIAGSEDERRRLVAMVAVRAGRQKPDFLPTSVRMRTSLTARWAAVLQSPPRPRDVDVLERTPGLRDPRQAGHLQERRWRDQGGSDG